MRRSYHLAVGSLLVFAFLCIYQSCKKPYLPPNSSTSTNYLVVEGAINSGADSTLIKLSRTVRLTSKTQTSVEQNAIVSVESIQHTLYPLTEIKPGTYACAGLNLDETQQYRLDIKTSDGKQYESDYVPVNDSPPIDSVSFDADGGKVSGQGVNLYVSTHDPSNKVQYFRWDYVETWEFKSWDDSYYKSNGDTVLPRDMVNDEIYQCWNNDTASNILLGNTARLSKSVIINQPVNFVDYQSEKLSVEYSILVRQYALTADAYNFYSILKSNSEQIGSIFDVQPSELQGNIHCVSNPQVPVIGYICIGNVATKRIFIRQNQLPFWVPVTFYTQDNCAVLEASIQPCCYYNFLTKTGARINQVDEDINYDIGHDQYYLIPINAIIDANTRLIVGYTANEPECVDCTLRGTNKQPSFWQ